MTEITFKTLQRILKALGNDFGRSAMMLFKDTHGRTWGIINGNLYGSEDCYQDLSIMVPFCDYGQIGAFEVRHNKYFEYKRTNSIKWHLTAGGVTFEFEIIPPFDCRDCKHLIYIDEEECGSEDGGYNCRYDWEAGDTYIASDTYDFKGCICKKFEPTEYALKRGLYGFRA